MNHFNPKLYWIETPTTGRLAISARPRGGDWLEDEIEGWREQGVDTVVSLLTASENEELGLTDEGSVCEGQGFAFCFFSRLKIAMSRSRQPNCKSWLLSWVLKSSKERMLRYIAGRELAVRRWFQLPCFF